MWPEPAFTISRLSGCFGPRGHQGAPQLGVWPAHATQKNILLFSAVFVGICSAVCFVAWVTRLFVCRWIDQSYRSIRSLPASPPIKWGLRFINNQVIRFLWRKNKLWPQNPTFLKFQKWRDEQTVPSRRWTGSPEPDPHATVMIDWSPIDSLMLIWYDQYSITENLHTDSLKCWLQLRFDSFRRDLQPCEVISCPKLPTHDDYWSFWWFVLKGNQTKPENDWMFFSYNWRDKIRKWLKSFKFRFID